MRGRDLLEKSRRPIEHQNDFKILSCIGNFYSVEPSNQLEDLKMTKFWFGNINKELADKRTKEEELLTLNEWSSAKQRIAEDIAGKYERFMIASDPSKLAVLKSKPEAV